MPFRDGNGRLCTMLLWGLPMHYQELAPVFCLFSDLKNCGDKQILVSQKCYRYIRKTFLYFPWKCKFYPIHFFLGRYLHCINLSEIYWSEPSIRYSSCSIVSPISTHFEQSLLLPKVFHRYKNIARDSQLFKDTNFNLWTSKMQYFLDVVTFIIFDDYIVRTWEW